MQFFSCTLSFGLIKPLTSEYDDTILNRFKDPGAGAISYHNGRAFEATRDIEAGEELFDDYGDDWLDKRPGTYADFVPRSEDFSKAAAVLRKIELGMYTDLFILFMICFETT